MDREKLDAILHELRQHLEALYGERLVHIILYGSQARGDATPESDIDVMIVLAGEVDDDVEYGHNSEMIAELSLRYDVVIICFFVALERFLTENSPFLRNVRQDGVML